MEKPILYCDCDGVILNTIEVAFQIMREMGCNMNNGNEIDYYFKKVVDWNEIFERASFINSSVDKLRYIKDHNIFRDVIILTKICGAKDEERLKRDLFREVLPDIKVITLQYGLSKGLVVPAKDNILVDDEIRNCKNWEMNNGTAILFSPYMSNLEKNIISNISDVINTEGAKRLLKTRNF